MAKGGFPSPPGAADSDEADPRGSGRGFAELLAKLGQRTGQALLGPFRQRRDS